MRSWRRGGPWGLLWAGAAGALLVSGCRLNPRSEEGDVRVRLINAVPDAAGLDVSVDGQRVWRRAPFRSNTGYQGIAAGSYPLSVSGGGLGETLSARSLAFEKGHEYTVLALGAGPGGGAQVQVFQDDAERRAEGGKAVVRLINAGVGLAPIDLVVNNIVGLKNVAYGKRSRTLLLDPGAYDLKVALADSPDPVAGPVTLRLEPGRTYTLAAMGRASDGSLSLEAYPDAR
jgi:hypothetical protein